MKDDWTTSEMRKITESPIGDIPQSIFRTLWIDEKRPILVLAENIPFQLEDEVYGDRFWRFASPLHSTVVLDHDISDSYPFIPTNETNDFLELKSRGYINERVTSSSIKVRPTSFPDDIPIVKVGTTSNQIP